MNRQILTFVSLLFLSQLHAQDNDVCPDIDSDGFVGVSDVLTILSFYGEAWPDCNVSVVEEVDSIFAIVFAESAADATFEGDASIDLMTYMMEGAPHQQWWGFTFGGPPDLTQEAVREDFLYWMDWPGFLSGTENSPPAQLVGVPLSSSSNLDSFGNAIEAYKFKTVEFDGFPMGQNVQFIVLVPAIDDNGIVLTYSSIGFDYNGSAIGATYQTGSIAGYNQFDLPYSGNNWPVATYRVHSNDGTMLRNWSPGDGPAYFRGGSFILD